MKFTRRTEKIMIHNLLTLLQQRVWAAIATVPTPQDWNLALILLVLYSLIALPIGFKTRLLKVEWVTSPQTILTTAAIALIFPAIVEELIFRVLLLPHPQETVTPIFLGLWSTICLGIFILAHPLNALIFFPSRRSTFSDPVFLTLAGLLGLICTISYLHGGCLWLPVTMHWLIVVVWLLCFGGEQRMTPIGQ
jgi:predicted Abi (CAAX) family protease